MIDFFASQVHFVAHLRPVWEALPAARRGHEIWRTQGAFLGYEQGLPERDKGPVVVCALSDLKKIISLNLKRPIVLMEHGVGLSFGEHPSYNGGKSYRKLATLTLAPNEIAAAHVRRAQPKAKVEVIGTPKLDSVAWQDRCMPREPVIALGFHWDGSHVCPEAGTAWEHYKKFLPKLAAEFRVIGHGHPRILKRLRPYYERAGIEVVERFEQVLERADIYVNDCSSTMYEFVASGKPVVVLNAPWFRREVQHGIRFWDYSDVGPMVNEPEELIPALQRLIEHPNEYLAGRQRAAAELYPFRGVAAQRAARAILTLNAQIEPARLIGGNCGVLYVAYGSSARDLCARSIVSLKQFHPDLPVAVISDEPVDGADRMILQPDISRLAREYKTRSYFYSPFDYTLFLDADTLVVGSLTAGFEALQIGWDIALALDFRPTVGEMDHVKKEGKEATLRQLGSGEHPHYNAGVIYYRKCPQVEALFNAWFEEWSQRKIHDQAPLLRALDKIPVTIWLLGPCWNEHRQELAQHVWHFHHIAERTA